MYLFSDMKTSTVCSCFGFLACFLATLTLIDTSPVDDVEDESPQNIRYLLNSLRHNGLSLLAPPSVYMNKLQPYLQKPPSKRNGFWIWMPAQGYVSVPQEEAEASSKGNGAGNVLRYG